MFFLLYRHTDDGIFDDFLKISQNCFKGQANVPEHFQKFPKIDFRGRPEDNSIMYQQILVQFMRQTWCQWNRWYLQSWGYGKKATWVPRCSFVWILGVVYFRFLNSFIIHQAKTKKMTSVKEVWLPSLN